MNKVRTGDTEGLKGFEPSSLAAVFDPSLATGSIDATLLTEFLGAL